MIEKENFISLNMLKKEMYTGSYRGMRFALKKGGEKPEEVIEVIIWPEPYNFEKTPDEKKQHVTFPFSEDGKSQSMLWLKEQYELQRPLWELR